MEELRDKLLQHLFEINEDKDKISEGLKLSRETYRAYRHHSQRIKTYYLSMVGVGLAAALFLGFAFLPSLTRLNSEQVFRQNYQRFKFQINDRGFGLTDPLTLSADLYMGGRLDEAIRKVDSLLTVKPDEIRAFLIKGLAELDKGNYQAAKAALTPVIGSGGSLGTTAEWYLSLIDLRDAKYQSAAEGLKKVKEDSNSPYSKKAAKLYHRLRYRKNK